MKKLCTAAYTIFSHNVLIENQYGFRKGRSCEHALLNAQNEILNALNQKQISLLLLIDFSKAFDMVEHNILLQKLYHYGIRGVALSWLKSYLANRKQYVSLNNKHSSIVEMEYGVPQGSILGPLMFIIYINDIPNICEMAKFILYADDANIIISGRNLAEIEKEFDHLSKKLENWVNINGLKINLKKTNFMIFSSCKIENIPFTPKIFNYEIERKINARFLGIIIQENLSWRNHIMAVKAKMSRYVGVLYKLKSIIPFSARKNIFQSFVQSHLNYCPLVWGLGSKSSIEPLFTEQKKAMRALTPGYTKNYYHKGIKPCHTKSYFTNYKILTVHSILLKNILIFMYKYYNLKHCIPTSVASIISPIAPNHTTSQENDKEWFTSYPAGKHRNMISFKGPLFYKKYI